MPRDFWIGLVVLGFAVLYRIEAGKIRLSPLDGPVGAPGLPKTLAYALGVLAIVMILRSLIARFAFGNGADGADEAVPLAERLRPHLRAIGILAIGVAYLLVVPWLGYAIAIMALILTVALYIGARLDLRTILVAVLGGVFFRLLFVEFLGIPLPKGVLLPLLM